MSYQADFNTFLKEQKAMQGLNRKKLRDTPYLIAHPT
jgi:hypothetical protein